MTNTNTIDSGVVPLRAKTGPKPKQLTEGTVVGYAVGRDKKVIPPEQVEELASLGCTNRDIANFFGINEDTLHYNFKDHIIKGKEDLKISLRRSMLKTAHSGNAALLIFLSKNLLGMSDNPIDSTANQPLPWNDD